MAFTRRYRRHRRGVHPALLGYALALVALFAQVSLPWLEGWHNARNARPLVAQLVDRTDGDDDLLRPAGDSESHHATECAVCRLIGQSRSALIAPILRVDAVVTAAHTLAAAGAGVAQTVGARTCAPRAPPALLA